MNTPNVKVGDLFRAFDFPGRYDCYFVGIVDKIDGGMIHARTVAIFSEGHKLEAGKIAARSSHFFHTPAQGLGFFDDVDQRIELIATADEVKLVTGWE